ncbi:transposon Ty3-I Gag-Pol polyprotein [Trichonephila clavipes]|nr:transposon Ty3-I Gag-Pol polyprotein [Trichonephila clavipes]
MKVKTKKCLKGVAEDIYQALLTREINDILSNGNYIEDMKQKRVGRPRFERLPNVVPVASLTDETISLLFAQSKTDVWRTFPTDLFVSTADVLDKYCRERKAVFDNSRNRRRTTTLALKKKYADQSLLAVLREADPNTSLQSPSPYRRSRVARPIFTGDHAPINQRAYRVSPTERRIIHEEVQKMLDEGIVQPSESPWSSPVVLVRKKTVVGVFCVDYRKLNSVTKNAFILCLVLTYARLSEKCQVLFFHGSPISNRNRRSGS